MSSKNIYADLIIKKKVVTPIDPLKQSSAKSLTLEDTIDGRSFMCKKKSIGPKTVPCGTPESTSTRPEDTPSTTTHCLRFF